MSLQNSWISWLRLLKKREKLLVARASAREKSKIFKIRVKDTIVVHVCQMNFFHDFIIPGPILRHLGEFGKIRLLTGENTRFLPDRGHFGYLEPCRIFSFYFLYVEFNYILFKDDFDPYNSKFRGIFRFFVFLNPILEIDINRKKLKIFLSDILQWIALEFL